MNLTDDASLHQSQVTTSSFKKNTLNCLHINFKYYFKKNSNPCQSQIRVWCYICIHHLDRFCLVLFVWFFVSNEKQKVNSKFLKKYLCLSFFFCCKKSKEYSIPHIYKCNNNKNTWCPYEWNKWKSYCTILKKN